VIITRLHADEAPIRNSRLAFAASLQANAGPAPGNHVEPGRLGQLFLLSWVITDYLHAEVSGVWADRPELLAKCPQMAEDVRRFAAQHDRR
jgi:hypothetical protein